MQFPLFVEPVQSDAGFISHEPRPIGTASSPDVRAFEEMLEEWFGSPVILLSSGRAGLHLYLEARGFSRHRSQILVPPFLSRCVLNALTPTTFPVHDAAGAEVCLLYHQYGFPQLSAEGLPLIVEDLAHSFFSSPESGVREWTGEAAIFSLPKFFPTGGLAGGLIVRDKDVAERVRERVATQPDEIDGLREWMRSVFSNAREAGPDQPNSSFLGSVYELLLDVVRPDRDDLAGVPTSLDDLARVGRQRQERVEIFWELLGREQLHPEFWDAAERVLPFAIPYFGRRSTDALGRINAALNEMRVDAGIYHVDTRRNMRSPDYRPCVLLPCHQEISLETFELVCRAVRDSDRES